MEALWLSAKEVGTILGISKRAVHKRALAAGRGGQLVLKARGCTGSGLRVLPRAVSLSGRPRLAGRSHDLFVF